MSSRIFQPPGRQRGILKLKEINMVRIVLVLLLFPCTVQAQVQPRNFGKEAELRAQAENISFMLNSLLSGVAKDDIKELRRKSEILKSVKNDIGEENLLRFQLMEDMQRIQVGVQFMGYRTSDNDPGSAAARLSALKKIEMALEKSVDPKEVTTLREKAESGRLKGALSSLRSAIQIYYGDKEGVFPEDFNALTEKSKYLSVVPAIRPPGHSKMSSAVKLVSGVRTKEELYKKVDDAGGWIYVNDRDSKLWGTVIVNCNHKDPGRDTCMYNY